MLSSNPERYARPVTPNPSPAVAVPGFRPPLETPEPTTSAAAALPAPELTGDHPLRKVAFYSSLALLLLRVGALSEIIASVTGINTYLLYLAGPPAIFGALLTGGIGRTFRHKAAFFWVAFFTWMVMSTPFSYWVGGSVPQIISYARNELPLLIVVGGLAITWEEIRAIFTTIAAGGMLNLLTARLFMNAESGRVVLADVSGTIGNSNDLAAQLILVLPFLAWIVLDRKRNILIRLGLVAAIGYGISVILGTASRGALIAMFMTVLYVLIRASMRQKIAFALVAGLSAALFFAITPKSALNRLGTLFGEENDEAQESADSRSYLFKKSVEFTLQHPVFGVGPDQFSNYEGQVSRDSGIRGAWHATHCAWTQVSSECGIPALIFFVGGIGSALWTVSRIRKRAKESGDKEVHAACFCYLASMTGFLTALTFLSNAYRFYFPVMVGLAIAMKFAAEIRFASAPPPEAAPAV